MLKKCEIIIDTYISSGRSYFKISFIIYHDAMHIETIADNEQCLDVKTFKYTVFVGFSCTVN